MIIPFSTLLSWKIPGIQALWSGLWYIPRHKELEKALSGNKETQHKHTKNQKNVPYIDMTEKAYEQIGIYRVALTRRARIKKPEGDCHKKLMRYSVPLPSSLLNPFSCLQTAPSLKERPTQAIVSSEREQMESGYLEKFHWLSFIYWWSIGLQVRRKNSCFVMGCVCLHCLWNTDSSNSIMLTTVKILSF